MKNLPILRLLSAGLMIYFALPKIQTAASNLEMVFWGMWLVYFLLVVGANLANLLRMIDPPPMEQTQQKKKLRADY